MFESEINFGHHLHSIRLKLGWLRTKHYLYDGSLSPLFSGKSSKSRVCVGTVKEYSSEFQQFGGGRELSDSGPALKGGLRSTIMLDLTFITF